MDELVDTFANRLSYALTVRNMKPIELSKITKIDKSKISSYMSGRYKAKTDGLKIIADALNVSPVWLMGYDVPMEANDFQSLAGYINVQTKNLMKRIDSPNYFEFIVEDEAMYPVLDIGDIAIIQRQTNIINNKYYLISLNNHKTIRKIIIDNDNYILNTINNYCKELTIPKSQIQILGKVMEAKNKSIFK